MGSAAGCRSDAMGGDGRRLVGIAVEGGMLAVTYNENMTAPVMAALVLVSGAASAAIAALAALLTHRFVLPNLLAVAV